MNPQADRGAGSPRRRGRAWPPSPPARSATARAVGDPGRNGALPLRAGRRIAKSVAVDLRERGALRTPSERSSCASAIFTCQGTEIAPHLRASAPAYGALHRTARSEIVWQAPRSRAARCHHRTIRVCGGTSLRPRSTASYHGSSTPSSPAAARAPPHQVRTGTRGRDVAGVGRHARRP